VEAFDLISNRCLYSIDLKVDAGAKKVGKSGKDGKTGGGVESARTLGRTLRGLKVNRCALPVVLRTGRTETFCFSGIVKT
jgi:hypothetical protein